MNCEWWYVSRELSGILLRRQMVTRMPTMDERAYLKSRAEIERALAAASIDPRVARIHKQLQAEYEERALDLTGLNPRLRIVREGPES